MLFNKSSEEKFKYNRAPLVRAAAGVTNAQIISPADNVSGITIYGYSISNLVSTGGDGRICVIARSTPPGSSGDGDILFYCYTNAQKGIAVKDIGISLFVSPGKGIYLCNESGAAVDCSIIARIE